MQIDCSARSSMHTHLSNYRIFFFIIIHRRVFKDTVGNYRRFYEVTTRTWDMQYIHGDVFFCFFRNRNKHSRFQIRFRFSAVFRFYSELENQFLWHYVNLSWNFNTGFKNIVIAVLFSFLNIEFRF